MEIMPLFQAEWDSVYVNFDKSLVISIATHFLSKGENYPYELLFFTVDDTATYVDYYKGMSWDEGEKLVSFSRDEWIEKVKSAFFTEGNIKIIRNFVKEIKEYRLDEEDLIEKRNWVYRETDGYDVEVPSLKTTFTILIENIENIEIEAQIKRSELLPWEINYKGTNPAITKEMSRYFFKKPKYRLRALFKN